MKAAKGSNGRVVDQPDPKVRFYLFYGPDEGQSRALAARLLESLGATKSVVAGSAVKSGTTSLADEAGALTLFGGKQLIWVEPATEDITEGVAALLEAPAPESAVAAIAGTLRKTSALLKLAEGSPHALTIPSYLPDGEKAGQMVTGVGRRFGLKIGAPVAARIAEHCANDEAIVARELEKFATYLDASPHSPRELGHEAVDAVGAESSDGAFLRLADLALLGDVRALGQAIEGLAGSEAIGVIRLLQRRILMLAPIRARIERGERIDAVMASAGRSLFFREKDNVTAMVRKWSAADLARVADRAAALERDLMFSEAPEKEGLGEALLAIARRARNSS